MNPCLSDWTSPFRWNSYSTYLVFEEKIGSHGSILNRTVTQMKFTTSFHHIYSICNGRCLTIITKSWWTGGNFFFLFFLTYKQNPELSFSKEFPLFSVTFLDRMNSLDSCICINTDKTSCRRASCQVSFEARVASYHSFTHSTNLTHDAILGSVIDTKTWPLPLEVHVLE